MRTEAELVAGNPALAGRLDPPTASPPPGVTLRRSDDGVRVLTINVHEGVPGGVELRSRNASVDALRDVARYVNAVDPDVVLVQELAWHPTGTWGRDLEEQPSILGLLTKADDMVFTPAFRQGWWQGETGTAIYTRNGYTIDHAVNAALPDGEATQPRGVAIAAIRAPGGDGDESFTVLGTHLAHGSHNVAARAEELGAIADMVGSLRRSGTVEYLPRMGASGSRTHRADSFPRERIVVGGDFNELQQAVDSRLEPVGLTHVRDALHESVDPLDRTRAAALEVATATSRRIDHLYAHGFEVTDAAVARVPNHDLRGDAPPTDHAGVIADLAAD